MYVGPTWNHTSIHVCRPIHNVRHSMRKYLCWPRPLAACEALCVWSVELVYFNAENNDARVLLTRRYHCSRCWDYDECIA